MNKIHEWINTGLILLVFISGLVGGNQSVNVGGMSNLDGLTIVPVESTDGFKLGTNGSTKTKDIIGSGVLIYSNNTVIASTTRVFDIAVTGVVAGDNVSVQLGTTSAPGLGWVLAGASASSTNGFITVQIGNQTGATTSVPPQISSSTFYKVDR